MKKIMLLLFVFLLVSCKDDVLSSKDSETLYLNEPFELGVGESVSTEWLDLKFTFDSVSDDTRYLVGRGIPGGGDATVVIKFSGKAKYSLHTNDNPNSVTIDRYHIQLLSLSPYPETSEPIDGNSYIAKFVVSEVIF